MPAACCAAAPPSIPGTTRWAAGWCWRCWRAYSCRPAPACSPTTHISKDASDWLTGIHHLNFAVLLVLSALHVAAALFYLLVKRDNLVLPMITGRKPLAEGRGFEPPLGGPLWLAALLLALCAGAVWALVTA
jgi:hypothetical protein